jgi:hypothetical protein
VGDGGAEGVVVGVGDEDFGVGAVRGERVGPGKDSRYNLLVSNLGAAVGSGAGLDRVAWLACGLLGLAVPYAGCDLAEKIAVAPADVSAILFQLNQSRLRVGPIGVG